MDILRKLWKRYVALPSPVELGRSLIDALPSRELSDDLDANVYCWEDYDIEVREHFPRRYQIDQWLIEISVRYRQLARAGDWIACHTYRRYHIINLSKAEQGGYTWGYIDPCEVMLLASFYALRLYVERENPDDPALHWTPAELDQEHLRSEKTVYDEAMSLYKWWTEERPAERAEERHLFELSEQFPRRSLERTAARDAWLAYTRKLDAKPHEMLMRLVKIQPRLWT